MRARVISSLLLVAMWGCQAGVTVHERSTAAAPLPSAAPAGATKTTPSPSPTPPAVLVQPKGGVAFTGSVKIDAAYALQHGGQLLSNNGSNLVLVDSNLLSEHGGGIISDAGGNILTDGGAGLISNNGGGLTGKTKLRLLTTQSPPDEGLELVAAGMRVGLISLETGEALPVGVDADNKPVMEAASGVDGQFTVYLPAVEANNVLLTAIVPKTVDTRLQYALVLAPNQAQPLVDERSSLVATYLRTCIVERLTTALLTGLSDPRTLLPSKSDQAATNAVELIFFDYVDKIAQAAKDVGLDQKPRSATEAVARQAADYVLANVDLTAFASLTTKRQAADATRPAAADPSLSVLNGALDRLLSGAATKLAQDPHAFDHDPSLAVVNAARVQQGLAPRQILKAADMGDVFANDIFASSDASLHAAAAPLVAAAEGLDDQAAAYEVATVEDATGGVVDGMLGSLFTGTDRDSQQPVGDGVLALIRAAK